MGVTIFVSLFTTRLILASLGASDFGVFNVVGSSIAMLGFLNSTLANATQRFMSYAEGEGRLERIRSIFNVSIVLHLLIALITTVMLLIAMWPLFHGIFNIDPDRVFAAKIIYFSLIISTILTIVNVPYDAVMNAHENMLYYSIVGILESVLRLAVAFVCVHTTHDKLIVYGILMAFIPFITLSIMKVYCHRHYDECVISIKRYWDRTIIKQIAGFFGWNFLTAISSLFTIQGIGIVLNHFWGAALNAAQGIAVQVNSALSNFSTNMMKALNPVITKSAGAGDRSTMNVATLAGCKFSTLLLLFFAVPVSLEIYYILDLWLKEVPEWAAIFVVLQLTQSVITQMATSASTAVYAQGDIKHYALFKSITNALPLVLTWVAFRIGWGPIWLYVPMIIIGAFCGDIVIIYYAHQLCGINIKEYLLNIVLPLFGTTIIMCCLGLIPIVFLHSGVWRLLLTGVLSTVGMLVSCFSFAITEEEKQKLLLFMKALFNGNTSHI